jgi:predicted membrane protein
MKQAMKDFFRAIRFEVALSHPKNKLDYQGLLRGACLYSRRQRTLDLGVNIMYTIALIIFSITFLLAIKFEQLWIMVIIIAYFLIFRKNKTKSPNKLS